MSIVGFQSTSIAIMTDHTADLAEVVRIFFSTGHDRRMGSEGRVKANRVRIRRADMARLAAVNHNRTRGS